MYDKWSETSTNAKTAHVNVREQSDTIQSDIFCIILHHYI